jgi:hypothetical protein
VVVNVLLDSLRSIKAYIFHRSEADSSAVRRAHQGYESAISFVASFFSVRCIPLMAAFEGIDTSRLKLRLAGTHTLTLWSIPAGFCDRSATVRLINGGDCCEISGPLAWSCF